MIVPIIAVTLAQLGSSTPVTVTINSCPVPDAISQLAQITHLPLKATKAADYGSLMVCVHDYPTDKLLQRVANDLGAKWEQEGSILYLKPDEASMNRLEALGTQQRIQQLKGELSDAAHEGLGGLSSQNKATESFEAPQRALATILSAIPVEQIARIGLMDRDVYAFSPTAMQKAFPSNAASLVRKAMQDFPGNLVTQGNLEPNRIPSIALLSISRGDGFEGEGIGADLTFYDKSGHYTNRISCSLAPKAPKSSSQIQPFGPEGNSPISIDESLYTSLTSEKRVLESMMRTDYDKLSAKISLTFSELSKVITDPITYEPTRLSSDYAIALAKHNQIQLIGWIPDYSVLQSFNQPPAAATPNAILENLKANPYLLIQDNQSDEDITPSDPIEGKNEYISRTDLKKLSTYYTSERNLGLNAYLTCGKYIHSRCLSGLVSHTLTFSRGHSLTSILSVNWDLIHLLNSLDAEDFDKLSTGGTVSYANFTGYQRLLLKNYIFGAYQPKYLIDPMIVQKDLNFGDIPIDGPFPTFSSEVTNAIPNCVPDGAEIVFASKSAPGYRIHTDATQVERLNEALSGSPSLTQLADKYYDEITSQSDQDLNQPCNLEIGKYSRYTVDVMLKNNFVAREAFQNYEFSDTSYFEVSQLPPAYQQEWNKELKLMKNTSF